MNDKNRNAHRLASLCGAAAIGLLSAAPAAHADTFGLQVAGGLGNHKVDKVDLGLVWDPGVNWWYVGGWHFSLTGEAHVAYWLTGDGNSRKDIYELGVMPVVRFIKDAGAIRPYFEAGAGVRGLTHPLVRDGYSLSTAFQFTEIIGVGAQFGGRLQYQAGLRFQHISNAGIKEPNPGINFSQLYLQYNF